MGGLPDRGFSTNRCAEREPEARSPPVPLPPCDAAWGVGPGAGLWRGLPGVVIFEPVPRYARNEGREHTHPAWAWDAVQRTAGSPGGVP